MIGPFTSPMVHNLWSYDPRCHILKILKLDMAGEFGLTYEQKKCMVFCCDMLHAINIKFK